jgi:FlaA1/EpsC-like NDP-sugar epimerase
MKVLSKLVNWYFKRYSLPYWTILIIDCLICYLMGVFVFALLFKPSVALANIVPITKTLILYIAFNIIGFKIFHTYAGIVRYSSFVDLQKVGYAMGVGFLCSWITHYVIIFYDPHYFFVHLNTRFLVAIYIASVLAMWGVRVLVKSVYDVTFNNDGALRTMIYGVKDGGVGLAKNINNEKPARFVLKGFISHDPHYTSGFLLGQKVYPVDDKLEEAIKDRRIKAVLVSPLRNDDFRSDVKLQDMLIKAGVHIYMSTRAKEWDGKSENEIKEISIEDLLPRDEIKVDMESVGNLLKGKKILITGSAGSIGSEMVKQIAVYHPAELMLIDQAETSQHDIRLMMAKEWPRIKTATVVASIANKDRMERIFEAFRPDYVFHAAAYKHVPMMENNPTESVQNNIFGTKVIADLSVKYGVKKFVMISTDKAVNPTNVMGCSKRICEIYVQSLDKAEKDGLVKGNTQFVTTRFGNVLGSNGSVIPLFKEQIKAGGPVTVTDPNIIRFFMLIPEACKLVLEAGTHGKGGEIFVFDMGKPVKIADLAQRMIMLSGAKDVKIKYVGLRAGEKLYEEVLSNNENTKPSFHEKIRIANVRETDYQDICNQIERLVEISKTYDDMETVKMMKEIVPEFKSQNSKYSVLD